MAQLGAAIGPRVSLRAARGHVAPMKEVALREGLGRLVEAELVYQRGLPPKATYTFKHALVQDTAYQSLLREPAPRAAWADRRRAREALSRARRPASRRCVARHSEEAGRTEQAIGSLPAGGQAARDAAIGPTPRPIDHLQRAIELLCTRSPIAPSATEQELQLLIELGRFVGGCIRGILEIPRSKRVYERARAALPSRWAATAPELLPKR